MKFSWGAAAQQFGKDLPTIGGAIDDIFTNKRNLRRQAGLDERQAGLDSLAMEKDRLNIADLVDKEIQQQEARKNYAAYQEEIKPMLQAKEIASSVEQPKLISFSSSPKDTLGIVPDYAAMAGSVVPAPKSNIPYAGPLSNETTQKTLSINPEELQKKHGLAFGSAYEPGIKEMLDKESEDKKSGIGGVGTAKVYGILRRQMAIDNPKLFDIAKARIEELKQTGRYDQQELRNYETTIESGDPIKAIEDINAAQNKTYQMLLGKEEAIPLVGRTAAASAEGSIRGQTVGARFNPAEAAGIDSLRKQFVADANVKDLKTVYSNFEKTKNVYNRYKSGKATPYELSQSLGFFANKALDPNSVVMPGEFERFATGLSAAGSIEALATKLLSGGLKLTPKEYEGMFNIVSNSMRQAVDQSKPVYDQYKKLAKDRNFKEEDIVGAYKHIFDKQIEANIPETKTVNGKTYKKVSGGWQLIK